MCRLQGCYEAQRFGRDDLDRCGPSVVSIQLDSHYVRSSRQFPVDERRYPKWLTIDEDLGAGRLRLQGDRADKMDPIERRITRR